MPCIFIFNPHLVNTPVSGSGSGVVCTVQNVYTELVRARSTVHVYALRGNIFGMSVNIAVVNTAIKVI